MADKRIYSAPGDRIETKHPVTVNRYRGYTRLNHWVTAACMIVLLISGLSFFHPSLFFLTGLFGGGQTTRWLHPIVGLILVASFLLLFAQMWKLNLPRREDVEWSRKFGDLLQGNEESLPELGKYNAGQKMVFWGMSGLIVVLVTTGIMIWEQYFPDLVSIPVRRIAVAVHSLAALFTILIFIVHVYAAIWTRGTIRAMTRGTVTGGWAFRHHRKWLRELAGRQGSDPSK
ncbi:formate dehydrogenase subunit gamma [Ensifer sp. ENS07]|jgi:formate dehydrogenase subunit gamma|uniref:formate dehydrogenase subunit gamma n=1 Tax=Ensifer TaxID=106591 RepID=UPI00072C0ED5|nr:MULTISPECIES: formate dehydrogenase subunit gamma [Ensifer]KSV73149.1 formate dehydrogenase-N subunit gamma [Sinorhizobium sp. GW3]OWZ95692.1 formate dehydrogenase subunit gamma [Sinorhizobium sp. LM21]MBD9493773.1 formate dehydrogenase subunit gamma [Ensifer sp. ENS01]MBD9572212.1 formate dehydrogenase subunit gamma [Ensifer sp. ENS08]MBD9624108.1 formate dehydrogenase subunit gamma [Ensifer sp. ENS06]